MNKIIKNVLKEMNKNAMILIIAFVMLGFVGLIASLGITVGIPFILGATGVGIRKTWSDFSGRQKIALGTLILFLLPFIFLGIILALIYSTNIWIELLLIIPTIFVVAFLITTYLMTSDERKRNIITRIFSNKIVGVIAILVLISILLFASYTIITQYGEGKINANGLTNSYLVGFDTVKTYKLGDTIPTMDMTIYAFDTLWYNDGAEAFVTDRPGTIGTQINIKSYEGGTPFNYLPIQNAIVRIEGIDWRDGISRRTTSGYTGSDGGLKIQSIGVGDYSVYIEASGYQTFKTTLNVTESMTSEANNKIFDFYTFPRPIHYQVRVLYQALNVTTVTEDEARASAVNYFRTLVPISYFATMQYSDFVYHTNITNSNVIVCIGARVNGGLSWNEIQNMERQRTLYGSTGLPKISNSIISTQYTMRDVYNSVFGALQSIIPAMQSTLTRYVSVETGKWYTGHSWTFISSVDDIAGTTLTTHTQATPNNLGNTTIIKGNTTIPRSRLTQRYYDFVMQPKVRDYGAVGFRLNLKFTTYYDYTLWYAFKVSSTSAKEINFVQLHFYDDRVGDSCLFRVI